MNANLGLDPYHHHHHHRRRPGAGSERVRGWATWVEDGVWTVGLCDGVVDQGGMLVDVSSATVAVTVAAGTGVGAKVSPIASSIPAWAFIGLPVKEFEVVVRPNLGARTGAGASTERLTLTMLRQIREKYRTQGSLGSLLTRLQEAKAGRGSARARARTGRTR